eukprot:TRINITY_DN2792_c0_g1_i1.p1 TRINITY_DN2792_c0_g1~~TRINITY_DN2792_c0_g1_i1.p1  ORF type:complete len:185 (-),score=17.32 TRINITY_DN2792_c0_g1_i1:33-587(-)
MEVRLIEEIEMRSTDQPWDIGSALLNDEKHCDVRIHFNNGDSWLAHRCILETALPLWKENWQKLYADEENPKQLTTVVMKSDSAKNIREFIKAVYTRNVPKDPDLMIAVCGLASKYHDWSLVSKCSKELVEVLDTYLYIIYWQRNLSKIFQKWIRHFFGPLSVHWRAAFQLDWIVLLINFNGVL